MTVFEISVLAMKFQATEIERVAVSDFLTFQQKRARLILSSVSGILGTFEKY